MLTFNNSWLMFEVNLSVVVVIGNEDDGVGVGVGIGDIAIVN